MKFPMIQKNCHVQSNTEDKIKSSIFCWFELHFKLHGAHWTWWQKQHTIDKLSQAIEKVSFPHNLKIHLILWNLIQDIFVPCFILKKSIAFITINNLLHSKKLMLKQMKISLFEIIKKILECCSPSKLKNPATQ